ncbi:hypothetical protein RJ639_014824 [Escallonia herrerae]|uniref:Uncharacterized protein n=1 Tax=Escallonia herrerae TaxID=1293975 RepID=A0AA88VGU3_9ASTE|nr:hypothetical protein RJ639_014824 [Escallonia herrerae]
MASSRIHVYLSKKARSSGVYDTKLRALRQDAIGVEDVTFEDLTVKDAGDVVRFLYQSRCSDYYSIDSLELGEMGFVLSRDRKSLSSEEEVSKAEELLERLRLFSQNLGA